MSEYAWIDKSWDNGCMVTDLNWYNILNPNIQKLKFFEILRMSRQILLEYLR